MSVAIARSALEAHGEFPPEVWRIFDKAEYATEFVEFGRFRFSQLRAFRRTPDQARRDSKELAAEYEEWGTVTTAHFDTVNRECSVSESPGWVRTHAELLSPTYALCCALPTADPEYLREKFGRYRVRIREPRRLAEDVCAYLDTLPWKFARGVEGCSVFYDKGTRRIAVPTTSDSIRLPYLQKPISYINEKEYRFVAISLHTSGPRYTQDYLSIDLGRRVPYLEQDEI